MYQEVSKDLMSFIQQSPTAFHAVDTMKKMDLNVVCLLDNINNIKSQENVNKRLYFYGKSDIIGGIWEIDPDRYSSGNGKIYYVNDKPFVSVKYSLWCTYAKVGEAPKSFLDEYINILNSLKPNIHSKDGYTVLNVHPWSISIQDLDYIVSNLNDDIELVYADELINLIKKNVRR